jgi:hypothetical protein
MVKAQEVERPKGKNVDEWVQLQKDFNSLIYQCKEKMNHAQSREETRAAFAEGMNNLIGLLKE